jgi:hypothetical protein
MCSWASILAMDCTRPGRNKQHSATMEFLLVPNMNKGDAKVLFENKQEREGQEIQAFKNL